VSNKKKRLLRKRKATLDKQFKAIFFLITRVYKTNKNLREKTTKTFITNVKKL